MPSSCWASDNSTGHPDSYASLREARLSFLEQNRDLFGEGTPGPATREYDNMYRCEVDGIPIIENGRRVGYLLFRSGTSDFLDFKGRGFDLPNTTPDDFPEADVPYLTKSDGAKLIKDIVRRLKGNRLVVMKEPSIDNSGQCWCCLPRVEEGIVYEYDWIIVVLNKYGYLLSYSNRFRSRKAVIPSEKISREKALKIAVREEKRVVKKFFNHSKIVTINPSIVEKIVNPMEMVEAPHEEIIDFSQPAEAVHAWVYNSSTSHGDDMVVASITIWVDGRTGHVIYSGF
ncbi:MAG: hypothetical protein ABIH23_32020 [bacterium]